MCHLRKQKHVCVNKKSNTKILTTRLLPYQAIGIFSFLYCFCEITPFFISQQCTQISCAPTFHIVKNARNLLKLREQRLYFFFFYKISFCSSDKSLMAINLLWQFV